MAGFTSYLDALRADVRAQLLTILGAADIATEVFWENVGNELKSVDPPAQGSGLFQRVFIDTASNRDISPGMYEHQGAVVVEIFDDLARGMERIEARAEALAALLRRRRLLNSMLKYKRAEIKTVGRNDELARWQGNLRVEFVAHEMI